VGFLPKLQSPNQLKPCKGKKRNCASLFAESQPRDPWPPLSLILDWPVVKKKSAEEVAADAEQGCQMAYFQTKNTNFVQFWRVLQ
jgi:hypothetical protein